MSRYSCAYCGLSFSGGGYRASDDQRFCCYGCYLVQRLVDSRGQEGVAAWLLIRLGIGAFLAMNVMMLSLVLYVQGEAELGAEAVRGLHWTLLALASPAVLILGMPYAAGAAKDLRARRIGMDMLILTGSVAAYCVSAVHTITGRGPIYFDTATMLLLIVTLGRLLEATAKNNTSKAIREVMNLIPATATVMRDGEQVTVASAEVEIDDTLIVRPGERVPADGMIVSGECMIEETEFTGESRPRSCGPTDEIYGGSLNCDGLIHVRALRVGGDALLSRMQDIVRRSQEQRAPIERLAERVAGVFVPTVWGIALSTALYWGLVRGDAAQGWLSALAVLVVACPCALGLATPIATCLAIGTAARAGVLISSGEVLERIPRVRRVFFDKTGTLTENELTVTHISPLSPGTNPDDVLMYAASLEAASEHSIGRAIVAEARRRSIDLAQVIDFRAVPGRGVVGVVSAGRLSVEVVIGSAKLMEHHYPGTHLDDAGELTCVYIGWGGLLRAQIVLADRARGEAVDAIRRLHVLGVETAVVSGDRASPTARLAAEVGINAVFAECSPEEKAEIITKSRLEPGGVAMVGDGINDAPALACADLGIAVGSGTDLAREASDLTLIGDDLSRIAWTIELSRQTYHGIRTNLWWAFGYNSVAIVLAFLGYVHPLIAATAMFASSAFVIGNSVRSSRRRDR